MYHEWLGIPPSEQPPNHYRLLGIVPFESDPNVISQAAERRMGQIRAVRSGQPADLAQTILNEIAGARLCLLDPNIKRAYDASLGKQTPPPLPTQTAEPPAKCRTVKRRPSPSLVALIVAGVALALMTGAGALAIWWLRTEPRQPPSKDRAVASSQDKMASPSSSKQTLDPAGSPAANVAQSTQLQPPKTPEPKFVYPVDVPPPAVTNSPAKPTDSSIAVRVQKGKGKKKAAKKPGKSGSKGKTNAAGYPTIAATWSGADGQSITIVQQRDQFTATDVGTDSNRNEVLWRWSGTVDREGHLTGRLVHTQASADFADQDASATLSSDGKTISGKSGEKAGMPNFPWKKAKPPGKKK